jgi:hypothetical protein
MPSYPHKYGTWWPKQLSDFELEGLCFKHNCTDRERLYHFRQFLKFTMPDLEWNEWLHRQMSAYCEKPKDANDSHFFRSISLTGCATAGKTFSAGVFAYHWWVVAPEESIVILTSTTKEMISRRVWPIIQQCHHSYRQNVSKLFGCEEDELPQGNLVDSRKTLEFQRGKSDRSIAAIAVKDGETSKAEANIRGQHAPRMLVIIDEANKTPEAIFGTIPNLRKATRECLVIVIGNPESRLDPHGKCCEPIHGWSSRSPDQTTWDTKGVPEWQIDPGVCLQFRGEDSPNVKGHRTVFPYLYTLEDYHASQKTGIKNTPRFWTMDAGEWLPDGFCNTVFSETMVDSCRLRHRHTFRSQATPISFLDPGFGGDACVQKIAHLGDLQDGRQALNVVATYNITLDPRSQEDYEHQIARQAQQNCAKHQVRPENFGLDATAIGRGVASILYTDWSPKILKLEFGGSPTEHPASQDDRRPAKEVYDRRVTELWFSAREFALAKQLGGLDDNTLIQFCGRIYDFAGKKYRLETKDDAKQRLRRSPDDADAVAGLVAIARERHGVIPGSHNHQANRPSNEPPDPESFEYQHRMATLIHENANITSLQDEFSDLAPDPVDSPQAPW